MIASSSVALVFHDVRSWRDQEVDIGFVMDSACHVGCVDKNKERSHRRLVTAMVKNGDPPDKRVGESSGRLEQAPAWISYVSFLLMLTCFAPCAAKHRVFHERAARRIHGLAATIDRQVKQHHFSTAPDFRDSQNRLTD